MSIQEVAFALAPRTLLAADVPFVPYTPAAPATFEPLTQLQVPALGLYSHKSLRSEPDNVAVES